MRQPHQIILFLFFLRFRLCSFCLHKALQQLIIAVNQADRLIGVRSRGHHQAFRLAAALHRESNNAAVLCAHKLFQLFIRLNLLERFRSVFLNQLIELCQ